MMKKLVSILLVLAAAVTAIVAQEETPATNAAVRFRAVDVYIDSNDKALAAYQVEVTVASGQASLAGIEGGEHAAFREPPFYDPKALQHERVIIAAFNTAPADRLPKGRTRVATLHFQVTGSGQAEYAVKLTTAATVDGKKIPVTVKIEERKAP